MKLKTRRTLPKRVRRFGDPQALACIGPFYHEVTLPELNGYTLDRSNRRSEPEPARQPTQQILRGWGYTPLSELQTPCPCCGKAFGGER